MLKALDDTDFYKATTAFAYMTLYPNAYGQFEFTDRRKENWLAPEFLDENGKSIILKKINDALCDFVNVTFSREHCDKMKEKVAYVPGYFWEWMTTFRLLPHLIDYGLDENGVFYMRAPWLKMYKATWYEIACLTTYTECRNWALIESGKIPVPSDETIIRKIDEKIAFANEHGIEFAEFGTRRRFDSHTHELVLQELKDKSTTCTGTSNIYYALEYDMNLVGTFPHEWVMFHAACFGYKRANYLSLEDWIKVYDGNLGIALVDTYTTKSFLRTLTAKQAKILAGFRADSGNDFKIGHAIIDRLNELRIDPRIKTVCFSNSLNMQKAWEIKKHFEGLIKTTFGIGTDLTSDVYDDDVDYVAASVVMKLIRCCLSLKDPVENCIKISDDRGKYMGDPIEFIIANHDLHLELEEFNEKFSI